MGTPFSATFEQVGDCALYIDPADERRWALEGRELKVQGIVDKLISHGSQMPDDTLQVSLLHLALLDEGTGVDFGRFVDLASFTEPSETIEMLESGRRVLEAHLGAKNG